MDRIIEREATSYDDELSLRPQYLSEYIGQKKVKENMQVFIQAAKERSEVLDHVLLFGPPGLGKTTLAVIIANELAVSLKTATGPSIEKPGDLAAILNALSPGDVLFIDEIHRLPKIVEEVLYSAMEDFYIDIVVGKDATAKSIRIDLPPFTLVGATTRAGDLSNPLRDRFGVDARLEYYTQEELTLIALRTADVFDIDIDHESAYELAKRSRGTPRIVNRLFRRVRDFAQVLGNGKLEYKVTKDALNRLHVDEEGLDHIDHRILHGIIERFQGGPIGLDALAASIGEDKTTIEEMYEPYLLQEGYITRTKRGRIATEKAYKHLNIEYNYEKN